MIPNPFQQKPSYNSFSIYWAYPAIQSLSDPDTIHNSTFDTQLVHHQHLKSSKSPLLLRSLNSRTITRPILNIKLNIDLPIQIRRTPIQSPGLDAGHIGHDLELGVQTRAAGRTEEVLIDLAAIADSVVGGWCSWYS